MRIILIIVAVVLLAVGILSVSPLFNRTYGDKVITISVLTKN